MDGRMDEYMHESIQRWAGGWKGWKGWKEGLTDG